MGLAMPVVWSDRHLLHAPEGEIWVGVRIAGTELPARADAIRAELSDAGATLVEAREHGDEAALAVHASELLEYLATAYPAWETAGLTRDPGQRRVAPYLFPHPDLFSGFAPTEPAAPSARAGLYAYDTMSLIGPGTHDAARAALDAAVTAAELVAHGSQAAYALVRPPGHHATRSAFGGSCYLNNTAAAAARLRATAAPVGVIDIDAHHGNGTQAIFWDDEHVLTGSVHVDPGAGWFPHYLGFDCETGTGGSNRNIPLAPGTGDDGWVAAVAELAAWVQSRGARALAVALGVDAAAGDPESPLEVSAAGYRAAGSALGALRLPTVIVQEGGYDLDTLGPLVRATLEGIEEGARV